jgi:hypothetical protein
VVAFPSVPQSSEEVFQMLFGEDTEQSITCYGDTMACTEIAEIVFRDVQEQLDRDPEEDLEMWADWDEENPQPLSLLEKVTKSFEHRYFYLKGSYADLDENENLIFYPICSANPKQYFGTKKGQLERCLKWEEALDNLRKEEGKFEQKIREENDLVDPPYNLKDSDEEMEAKYEKTESNYEKLRSMPEWKAKQSEFRKKQYYMYRRWEAAKQRTAELDAKAFLEDNPDAFILFTSYSDDSTEGGIIEHGEVFSELPYVRISNH